MNSSVTQLIAESAGDLAAAWSPRDPAAGLWKRDSVWVPSLNSPEELGCARAPMNSWCRGFCRLPQFCDISSFKRSFMTRV